VSFHNESKNGVNFEAASKFLARPALALSLSHLITVNQASIDTVPSVLRQAISSWPNGISVRGTASCQYHEAGVYLGPAGGGVSHWLDGVGVGGHDVGV
jgi:hypothetical protein